MPQAIQNIICNYVKMSMTLCRLNVCKNLIQIDKVSHHVSVINKCEALMSEFVKN